MNLLGNKFMAGRMGWLGFACIGAGALLFVSWREFVGPGYSVTPGTDVARVAVRVTHGTNHLFYYRGKHRWLWNDLCKRFGWRMTVDAERRRSWTVEPADMLWVMCEFPGEPLHPHLYRVLEVSPEGRRRQYDVTGGIRDTKRRTTVTNVPLRGGLEKHRGSVIHVKWGTKELATIEVQ